MKSIISEVNSEEEKKIKQMYVNAFSIYNEIIRFKKLSELKIYRKPGLSLINPIFVPNFLQATLSKVMDRFLIFYFQTNRGLWNQEVLSVF